MKIFCPLCGDEIPVEPQVSRVSNDEMKDYDWIIVEFSTLRPFHNCEGKTNG